MAAYAIDWINGTILCPCEGNANAFVNLDTGEIQCAVTCSEEPLCRQTWSVQDGQFNLVCDDLG